MATNDWDQKKVIKEGYWRNALPGEQGHSDSVSGLNPQVWVPPVYSNEPTAKEQAGSNASSQAMEMLTKGTSAIDSALGTATQHVGNIDAKLNAANAQTNADLNVSRNLNQNLGQVSQSLGSAARDINKTATQMGEQADIFQRFAQTLERDATFARANALPWLQTSEDILGMNKQATGMGGEWNKLYDQLSPEMFAAKAATNARGAAATAQNDLLRSLAQRGISAGSGAISAALGKLKERENATVAAMMTNARQMGLAMQTQALEMGFKMALDAGGMGKTFIDQAISATAGAIGAQGQATEAIKGKGSLQSQAASIVAAQGNLDAARGNLALGIAGQVSQTAVQSVTAKTSAIATQAEAAKTAADYYSTQAGSILGLMTQNGFNMMKTLFG